MRWKVRVVFSSMAVTVALLTSACGILQPAVDSTLAVSFPEGGRDLYPGATIACDQTGRCDDYLAEVRRWAARTSAGRGDPASITFHEVADSSGQGLVMTRSGGGTWIAVVTFRDGSRAAALVGCGVGIDMERCFSSP
jgi:hypothetical protein